MIQVVGDRIWLTGTTIEEVEVARKATLQLVLDEPNREYGEYLSGQNMKQEGGLAGPKSSDIQVREATARLLTVSPQPQSPFQYLRACSQRSLRRRGTSTPSRRPRRLRYALAGSVQSPRPAERPR